MATKPLFVYKVAEVKAPTSGKVKGYRIKLAHANLAAHHPQGYEYPSFAKRYLIAESSDYLTRQRANDSIAEFLNDKSRFLGISPSRVIEASCY